MFIFQKKESAHDFLKDNLKETSNDVLWLFLSFFFKNLSFLIFYTKPSPHPFPHPILCTVTISKGSASEDDFPQLFWDPYLFTLPKYSLKSLEDWTYTLYPIGGICHSYSELKISWIKLQQVLYKYLEICKKVPIFFLFIREFWTGNFPIQKPWISSIIFSGLNISETLIIYICLKM